MLSSEISCRPGTSDHSGKVIMGQSVMQNMLYKKAAGAERLSTVTAGSLGGVRELV